MGGETSEERRRMEMNSSRFKRKTAWVMETDLDYDALGGAHFSPKWRNSMDMVVLVFENRADALKAVKEYSDWCRKKEGIREGVCWAKIKKALILSRR